MNKILVTLFADRESAYKGLNALRDLHGQGDITLYASSVIAKQPDGTATELDSDEPGPVGTAVGLLTGTLLGMLGGPVGVAVGATVGVTGGMLYDLIQLGIGSDFIDDVTAAIQPGTVAVVADIDEGWITPVEVRMAALGGQTVRRTPSDIADEQLNRDIDAMSAELAQLNVELQDATIEAGEAISKRIEADVQKVEQLKTRADTAIDKAKANYEARLATLRAQRERAAEQRKAAIDERIGELKANFEQRKAKLERAHELSNQAAQLRREALTPTR